MFLESGGDNLAASFSPELVDASIYVIDVSGGDKIPRKGGPGVTRSDLLVINKIDLAPMVGADLDVMARDAKAGAATVRSCSPISRVGKGSTRWCPGSSASCFSMAQNSGLKAQGLWLKA